MVEGPPRKDTAGPLRGVPRLEVMSYIADPFGIYKMIRSDGLGQNTQATGLRLPALGR